MGPVFIRRGEVLFVIDSPREFIEYLKSGKILPTDMMLVRDRGGVEWLQVSKIERFDFGAVVDDQEIEPSSSFNPKNLFDHIKRPRFNLSAFIGGGFWYLLRDMSQQGTRHLGFSSLICAGLVAAGIFSGLPVSIICSFALAGWFGYNVTCGLHADHDLNRRQVERFHQQQEDRPTNPVLDDPNCPPVSGNEKYRIPTVRERILN